MAQEWVEHVRRWYALTEELVEDGGRAGPDSHERYRLFQTLAGVHPITPERLEGYVEKALREGQARHELGRPGPRLGGRA